MCGSQCDPRPAGPQGHGSGSHHGAPAGTGGSSEPPLTVPHVGHDESALSGLLFFSAMVHIPFWTARNRTGLRSPYSPEATSMTVEQDRTPERC